MTIDNQAVRDAAVRVVEEAKRRGRRLQRKRRLARLSALAVAAVLTAAAATTVSLLGSGPSGPTRVATTSPSTSSSTSTTTPPTTAAPPKVVGPWNARVVPWGEEGGPIAGDAGSLYLATSKAILRVNPATGAVLARHDLSQGPPSSVGIAGGALWLTTNSGVAGLDLTTLAPVGSITVPGADASHEVLLAANGQDSRLYLATSGGNTVDVVDATTHEVINHYQVAGDQITSMAVSPDDTRLYLVREIPHPVTVIDELTVVDASTGAVIAASIPLLAATVNTINAASAGGIWVTSQGGTAATLDFLSASNLAQPEDGAAFTTAGGGWPASATVGSNVVWIGGTSSVTCADPTTGTARASAPIRGPTSNGANISHLTQAGGRLFATYLDGGARAYLISLTPPAQCAG